MIGKVREETCSERLKSRRSVEFSSVAKDTERNESTRRVVVTRNEPGSSNFRESRRLVAFMVENSESVDGNDTTSSYLLLTFHILRKSSRTSDMDLVVNRETKWKISMWTFRYGEYLWPPLFKPQFILESKMQRICILPKISPSEQCNSYSMYQVSWSRIRKKSKVYLEKDNFSYWQGSSVIRCKYLSVLRLSIVYGRDQWKSRQSMEGEDWLVSELTSKKRIGSNRWRADGVRVDKFPRVHYIADPRRDSKVDDWIKAWTWANPRTDYPHVNVQRHCMERRRKQWIVYCEFLPCCRIYKKIRARSWASSEKQWYGGHVYKPNGEWDKVADIMMMNLQ